MFKNNTVWSTLVERSCALCIIFLKEILVVLMSEYFCFEIFPVGFCLVSESNLMLGNMSEHGRRGRDGIVNSSGTPHGFFSTRCASTSVNALTPNGVIVSLPPAGRTKTYFGTVNNVYSIF